MVFCRLKWFTGFGSRAVLSKASRSSNRSTSLIWRCCYHRTPGSFLDPEMRAFLEENTEVSNSGHLTPEIRLRLLTPRCRFWQERADLWPYGDPFWAIYWPGGQALSRSIHNLVSAFKTEKRHTPFAIFWADFGVNTLLAICLI
uniref:Uncharacterized protein n=1 Tax=Gopherus agassizii TaxID=38772 RepID=A0A452HCD4_9SAUR